MDAIAVTLTMNGTHTGVAPLGTALTEPQAAELAGRDSQPIIATDADNAGRAAAEHAYWTLTHYQAFPRSATLPESADPAALVEAHCSDQLSSAIDEARPLAEVLIEQRLNKLTSASAALESLRVIAAEPPEAWELGYHLVAERTGIPTGVTRSTLADFTAAWSKNPPTAADRSARDLHAVVSMADQATEPPPMHGAAEHDRPLGHGNGRPLGPRR